MALVNPFLAPEAEPAAPPVAPAGGKPQTAPSGFVNPFLAEQQAADTLDDWGPGVVAGPGRAASILGSFAQGGARMFADIPREVGLQTSRSSVDTLGFFDSVDSGGDFNGLVARADTPGKLAYLRGNEQERAALRDEATKAVSAPQQSAFYKAGEAMDAWVAKNAPTNPEYDKEFWSGKVPAGLGSMFAFMGEGLLMRRPLERAGLSRKQAVGGGSLAGGATSQAVSGFQDAIEKGASIEDAFKSHDLNRVLGASEAVPIASILDRVDKGTGGLIKRTLVNGMKGGTEEAIQESFQNIISNLIASDVVKYDPQRGMWTGTGEGAAVGFTTGGLVSVLGTLMFGRRANVGDDNQVPLTDEQRQAAEAVLQPDVGASGPIERTAPAVTPDQIVQHAAARAAALNKKVVGTPDTTITRQDGKKLTIRGKQAEILTDAEKAELDFLAANIDNPEALAKGYGATIKAAEQGAVEADAGTPPASVGLDLSANAGQQPSQTADQPAEKAAHGLNIGPQQDAAPVAPAAQPTSSPKIPFGGKRWNDQENRAEEYSGEAEIVDFAGRRIVVVDINGVQVPFYQSTGAGGKKETAAGKWYPLLGIGREDGWLNKASGAELAAYYNIPALRDAAENLDRTVGDIRARKDIPKTGLRGGRFIEFINSRFEGQTPTGNNGPATLQQVRKSIAALKTALDRQQNPTAGAQPQASEGLVMRADGTPFKTEKAARTAMTNRRLSGHEVVPVGEGFALRQATQEVTQEQDNSETVRGDQGQTAGPGPVDEGSRIPSGGDLQQPSQARPEAGDGQAQGAETPEVAVDRQQNLADEQADLSTQMLDPDTIEADAERFQFKRGGDAEGVTTQLKGTRQWDDMASGVAVVWEDTQGRRFIVDGHQRLALAKRLKAEGQNPQLRAIVLREADGVTAKQARFLGALKNLQEGGESTSPVDVARVIREGGNLKDVADVIPPNRTAYRDGLELAKLSDDAFGAVLNELIQPSFAAEVARRITDPAEQNGAIQALIRAEPENMAQARQMVDQIVQAGFDKTQGEQGGLFGAEQVSDTLLKERAKVLDSALRRLRGMKRVFSAAVTGETDLSGAGNVLNTEANKEAAGRNARIAETIARSANTAGDISTALTAAARAVRGGKPAAQAAREFLDAIAGTAEARGQSAGQDQEGGGGDQVAEPRDSFELTPPTKTALQQNEERVAKAEKAQRDRDREAEKRRKADREAAQFELTGSTLPADANPRQGDLVSAAKKTMLPTGRKLESTTTRADDEREAGNIPGGQRAPVTVRQAANPGRGQQLGLFTSPTQSKKKAYADLYGTVVKARPVGTLRAATDTIKNAEDAAHLFASIRKSAQEALYVAVTDKNGNVLRVIRHTKGTKDASNVSALTVVAEAASIPGAKKLILAHNHPSGRPSPSISDISLTRTISTMLDGTGMKLQTHVILGKTTWSTAFDGVTESKIEPRVRRASIPVTERFLVRRGVLGEIANQNDMEAFASAYDNALILMNHRHDVVGVVPMTPAEMRVLRDGGRVNRILTAIDKTNASAAAIKTADRDAAKNLARFLNRLGGADMRVLDWIDGDNKSSAAEGGALPVHQSSGPFFSRTAPVDTDSPAFERWFNGSQVVNADGKPLAVYHGTNKDVTRFKPGRGGGTIWFAEKSDLANLFVGGGRRSMGDGPANGAAVYPVYLSIQKPLDLGAASPQDNLGVADVLRIAGLPADDAALRVIANANLSSGYAFVSPSISDPAGYLARQYAMTGVRAANTLDDPGLIGALKGAGFDGIAMREEGSRTYAVFRNTQIKSAISNTGEFSDTNPDITASRGTGPAAGRTVAEVEAEIEQKIGRSAYAKLKDRFVVVADTAALREDMQRRGSKFTGMLYAKAFHGTPHIWAPEPGFPHGRPRLDKIGTGEGAAAFGWGWYSAESDAVGKEYTKVSPNALVPPIRTFKGKELTPGSPAYHAATLLETTGKTLAGAKNEVRGWIEGARPGEDVTHYRAVLAVLDGAESKKDFGAKKATGQLYALDIPDDALPYLLDRDKPLSEQTQEVRKALETTPPWRDNGPFIEAFDKTVTGQALYAVISHRLGGDRAASEYLASIGIVGNRYLDAGSRGDTSTPTYNYVIWDQKTLDRIALLERNGEKLDAIREREQADAGADANPSLSADGAGRIKGLYDPSTETSYIVAGNLTAQDSPWGVFLHEVGEHYGLERMIGPAEHKKVLVDTANLLRLGVKPVLEAARQVNAAENVGLDPNAPTFKRLFADKMRENPALAREVVAYMAQNPANHNMPLMRRIVAAVRAFLRKLGIVKQYRVDDIMRLVEAAARKARGFAASTGMGASHSKAAPVWYSQLRRALATDLPVRGPAAQMKAAVEAFQKKGRFKPEELEWSDLLPWLDAQEGTVTRDSVLEQLDLNAIEVRDVTLSDSSEKQTKFNRSDLVTPGGENYREVLLTLPVNNEDYENYNQGLITKAEMQSRNFYSSHFPETPNIVAHVRLNDRRDAEGKRVLFVEEVQSDWHQTGRKSGYFDPAKPWEVFDPTNGAAVARFSTEAEAKSEADRRSLDYAHGGAGRTDNAVPDAPFKQSWPVLAMKRVLRMAVDGGYDSVAWVTGEQTQGRYDLSKQVDSVTYSDDGVLRAFKGKTAVITKNATPEEVPGIIGKEPAERLLAMPSTDGYRVLEGAGLKVGGEWAVNLYDKQIPNELNKYVKKWGGRVGETILSPTGEARLLANDDPQKAAAIGAAPVHSIELTPAMRDAISEGQPLFSRVRGTADQEQALEDTIGPAPGEKRYGGFLAAISQTIGNITADSVRQGMFDQFRSIAAYEERANAGIVMDAATSAWKMALTTKNLSSVVTAMMVRGPVELVNGEFRLMDGRKGVIDIFKPLADRGLLRLWEGWAAANRAQRLMAEGRENNFTQAQIDTLLDLENQYPEFRTVLEEYQDFNKAVLDMAEAAGVIDPVARATWERNDYVPFYRIIEDAQEAMGPPGSRGIAKQSSGIRTLRGGEQRIGSVLENIVMNMAHLVDASYKNEAMRRTVELTDGIGMHAIEKDWKPTMIPDTALKRALEAHGVNVDNMTPAQKAEWSQVFSRVAPQGPDVVWVLKAGKPAYYRVTDPLLLRSVLSFGPQAAGVWMKTLKVARRTLTKGVTVTPEFMAANFVRDTLSTWVVSDRNLVPLWGAAKGFVKALTGSGEAITDMMTMGGLGHGFYDVDPQNLRRSMEEKAHLRPVGIARTLWRLWQRVGFAFEQANRVAIFEATIKNGGSRAEAAHQARDIMDFSMRGDWAVVQFLADTVPFLNARLQGLYKLGRGAAEHPVGFFIKGSLLTAATLMLLGANDDDDRYNALPEWEKDLYWHFWIDDEHFKIPKPFEIGAIFATIPERTLRAVSGRDTSKATAQAALRVVADTFAFNPMPQLFKPVFEQAMDYNIFLQRRIVPMRLSRLPPELQYDPWTSESLRELSKVMPPGWLRSPKRLEHLLRGYFGSLSTYLVGISDRMVRAAGDYPERPAGRATDIPLVGRFYKGSTPGQTRYTDAFYDLLDEAETAASAVRELQRQGLKAEANELKINKGDILRARLALSRQARRLTEINKQIRNVYLNGAMTPEQKRDKLDELGRRKAEIVRMAVERYEGR